MNWNCLNWILNELDIILNWISNELKSSLLHNKHRFYSAQVAYTTIFEKQWNFLL